MKIAIYPGTFDPFTNGHLDLVTRGLKMFDHLIIAAVRRPSKASLFTSEERMDMINGAMQGMDRVTVELFDGLLVDYVKQRKGTAIIRGLRAVSDFEYELQMALMNRKLENVETVFMMPSLRYIFLSSTIIKDAALAGGSVKDLVPENVEKALKQRAAER